jgi:peptidoglycan/LPS O-acetylase OafA/YrhL
MLRNLQLRSWRSAMPLDQPRAPGDDNALLLRHLASFFVLFGHSYDLTRHAGEVDPIARWLPGFTAGTLAVYLFFTLSGYLLMLSLQKDRGVIRYVWHRTLRIIPAYWVMLLACVLLLGPVFTTLPLADYLAHTDTWAYLRGNLLPLSFEWTLPGVFAENPLPGVINGSLWSLGLELRWYAYLGLLLAVGAVARRWVFTAVAVAFVAFAGWEWWIGKPDPLHYRALSVTFVVAALAAQWRHVLVLSVPVLLAGVAAAALASDSRWFGGLVTAVVMYGALFVTYRLPPSRWPTDRDYSYGLFLYGFPVQQTLLSLWPTIPPLALFGSASLIGLGLAAASWHLVEEPALRLKNRDRRRVPAAGEAASAYQTRSSGT